MVKYVKFYFLVLVFLGIAAPAFSAQHVSRVAAVVDDKVISIDDLRNRVRMAILSSGMPESTQMIEQLSPEILRVMIEEQLQIQFAEKMKIKIDEGRLDYAMQEIEQRNQMTPGQLTQTLVKNNIDPEAMRTHIKAGILWGDYIRARYGDSIQVTPGDIDRKLQEIKASVDQPQVLLSEIVLPVEKASQEASVLKSAKNLVEKIQKGASFPTLAGQFSIAATAAKGGDMGWISLTHLDDTLRGPLEKLQPGMLSAPLRTKDGFAIFLVKDKRASGESQEKDTFITFIQALFPIPKGADQETMYRTFTQAQSISNNAKSCAVMARLLDKNKGAKLQKIPKASVGNMPPELRKLLEKLDIEKASAPLLTDLGAIVFMVCERETVNPSAPSNEEVKQMLVSQELSNIAQRELRNLKRSAHIDIRL